MNQLKAGILFVGEYPAPREGNDDGAGPHGKAGVSPNSSACRAFLTTATWRTASDRDTTA